MKKNDSKLLLIFTAVFGFVALIYIVLIFSNILSNSDFPLHVVGTLIGMVLSAFITVLLLKGQTAVEEENDIGRRVFEKKQDVYFDFIETLEKITQDGKLNIPGLPGYVKPQSENDINDELQHLIYQLGKVQMTASLDTSKSVTAKIGKMLSILNNNRENKGTLYSEFAENLFSIVADLRRDLFNTNADLKNPDAFDAIKKDYILETLKIAGFENSFKEIETTENILANYCDLIVSVLKEDYNANGTHISFGGGNNKDQEYISSMEAAEKFLIQDNKARYIRIRTPLSGNLKLDIELVNDPRNRNLPIQGGLRKISWSDKFDYNKIRKTNFVLRDAAFEEFKKADENGRIQLVKDMLESCDKLKQFLGQ